MFSSSIAMQLISQLQSSEAAKECLMAQVCVCACVWGVCVLSVWVQGCVCMGAGVCMWMWMCVLTLRVCNTC